MSPPVPVPYPAPLFAILTDVILFNPWSTIVVIVCAKPVAEVMLVIPTPITLSLFHSSKVSLVILFLGSLTTTSPIILLFAKHCADSGSDLGLSLSVWGKSSCIGWENFSLVNGDAVGELDAFIRVR